MGPRPASGQTVDDMPAVCRIGVNIEDLYDLDMARDTFGAILWIWSVCPSADWRRSRAIAFPTASSGPTWGRSKPSMPVPAASTPLGEFRAPFGYNWDMDPIRSTASAS